MRTIHFETRDGIFEGMVHLYVNNTRDLSNVLGRISRIKGVKNVIRLETDV